MTREVNGRKHSRRYNNVEKEKKLRGEGEKEGIDKEKWVLG